jgi:hypothetical protein
MPVTLQRLVLTFSREGVEIRTLYRTKHAPNQGTKASQREVEELVCEGLRQALVSLEGRVDVVGTSGYEVREDTLLLAATSADALKTTRQVKGA